MKGFRQAYGEPLRYKQRHKPYELPHGFHINSIPNKDDTVMAITESVESGLEQYPSRELLNELWARGAIDKFTYNYRSPTLDLKSDDIKRTISRMGFDSWTNEFLNRGMVVLLQNLDEKRPQDQEITMEMFVVKHAAHIKSTTDHDDFQFPR